MKNDMAEIRQMDITELKEIYERITQDFAEGEYPPFVNLKRHFENNIQKGWILVVDGRDTAYSICAEGADGYVLISFFAVYKEYRKNGLGTLFLDKLKEIYSEAQGIIVEVEKVEEALHQEEVTIRERRLEFYRRAGFILVPGIEYVIWDVPMHLMVCPSKKDVESTIKNIGEIIYQIYLSLLGKNFINKLEFKKINQ